jgi:hypothetical protein
MFMIFIQKMQLPLPDEEFIQRHRRDLLTEQLAKQFLFLVKEEVN